MNDAYQGAQDAEFRYQRTVMERFVPLAVEQAMLSPCAKSKRGALVIDMDEYTGNLRGIAVGGGFNHPPHPMRCDGTDSCRAACGRVCEHAEAAAIRDGCRRRSTRGWVLGFHMLHVKAVDGVAVPSGEPSCEKCSVTMLAHGIAVMWLLRPHGLEAWSMVDFHEVTLRNLGLPVIR